MCHDAIDFHAGAAAGSDSASSVSGRCVWAICAATGSETSAANTDRYSSRLMYDRPRPQAA